MIKTQTEHQAKLQWSACRLGYFTWPTADSLNLVRLPRLHIASQSWKANTALLEIFS